MSKVKVKIANFNLQSGVGTTKGYLEYLINSWKYILPHSSDYISKAGDLLSKEGIDIVSLNEVDGGSYKTMQISQPQLVLDKMGLKNSAFFPTTRSLGQINMGNAIIAKYDIIKKQNYRLPGRGEPRYLGETILNIDGREVTSLVTHLSLNKKTRENQILYIIQFVKTRKTPVILSGDFNTADETELERLTSVCGLEKVATTPTFPSWSPKRSFDKIYLSKEFKVEKSYVFDELKLSDHLPVIVEAILD
jgi:endonuclease/exonuclease/phosphatase family metal-dependent hydrolase